MKWFSDKKGNLVRLKNKVALITGAGSGFGRVIALQMAEEGAKIAVDMINNIIQDAEVGKLYMGKVRKIMDFGAFVYFPSGESGLVHISQLANERVQNVRDVVREGDEILVKVIGIDSKTGKVRLSRKEALSDTSR